MYAIYAYEFTAHSFAESIAADVRGSASHPSSSAAQLGWFSGTVSLHAAAPAAG